MRALKRIHVPAIGFGAFIALIALTAMNTQNNLLFLALGVMLAAVAVSLILARLMLGELRLRRLAPPHGSVGEPLIIRYALSNRRRWLAAFNIHILEGPPSPGGDWQQAAARAWVMHVGPRETVHGEAILWPTRRGRATFGAMRMWTTFPFGALRLRRTLTQPQQVLIYPRMYELRRDLLRALTPPGLMGMRVSQHAGAGDDYYGMREFRPGDSMRHVAWRRTARMDELVTIERASPSPAKLRVVLNLLAPARARSHAPEEIAAGRALEEQAISLAASVVHAAHAEGFEVGLTVLGLPMAPIALRRNHWHLHTILSALAGIDLDAPRAAARPQPIRDAERAGQVVISPDRVAPLADLAGATYLTAPQLDSLAVRRIGWSPALAASAPRAAVLKVEAPTMESAA